MKFNWGHGLAVGMVLFMAYILFMVIQAVNTDFNLETDDYYAKELKFQEVIDKKANYEELNEEANIQVSPTSISIALPGDQADSGSIHLYRPSDAQLDEHFELSLNNENEQIISVEGKTRGRYVLELDWYVNGEGYFLKKNINL